MREEKKKAESQLRALQRERELQEETLRKEAEKVARVRSKVKGQTTISVLRD